MGEARLFKDDDDGHLAWLSKHPDGYVVNMFRPTPSKGYLKLHSAVCHRISTRSLTNRTTNRYMKACAEKIEALEKLVVFSASAASSPGSLRLVRRTRGQLGHDQSIHIVPENLVAPGALVSQHLQLN